MRALFAATATHAPGGLPWWAWIALGLVGWGLYYIAACRWRPWAHCFCCKGTGRHYRKDGRVFRDCWWCRRTPSRRLRIGRRVWNRFAKLRDAAQ